MPCSTSGIGETFYAQYAGTGYDWNAWYPELVSAIRAVDASTPILVGGNGYSGVEWLSYFQPVDDPYMVYAIHQYSPHEYTHQDPPDPTRTYPGYFDMDYDDYPETFDHAWLESLLSAAVDFSAKYNVPIVVNEFGAERWVSGAADYIRAEMDLFEFYGWNYAAWQWQPAWQPLTGATCPLTSVSVQTRRTWRRWRMTCSPPTSKPGRATSSGLRLSATDLSPLSENSTKHT